MVSNRLGDLTTSRINTLEVLQTHTSVRSLKYSSLKVSHSMVLSLGALVPNSRDRQEKLWLPKKQKTTYLTITFPLITSHKSLYNKLLAP